MNKNKKAGQSEILPEDMEAWVMPEPVDLYEEHPVDEAEEYLRRAKEREHQRREAELAIEREQAAQLEKIRQSNANLQNKNFTYDYDGAPIIINNRNNNNFPGLSYQVKHSIQDAKTISSKPKRGPQMREITNVKKSSKPSHARGITNLQKTFKPNLDSEQEVTQKHIIQASVPTYDLLEPQAGVTYIEDGKVITSSKGRYESTFAQAGSLISSTFGANTRLSRNEYLQLTKSNSSLVGMSIRGRDFGTQVMQNPALQQPQISPITPPNMNQIRNLPPLVSPGDEGIMSNKPVLTSLNQNSASTPYLENTGFQGSLPHSNKNLSRNVLDNTGNPRVRPNTDKTQPNQEFKENADMGTMSYGGNMNKGLVYYDSERVKSLLALDEDLASQVVNRNQSKQELYQAMYNLNNLNTNNNISSKISPVDLHNTNIMNSKEWGKATYSMTGNSSLPVLPNRKPQIGGGQNTLGGKNMRHRVSAAGTGNGYAELLHSTIRNQQIV